MTTDEILALLDSCTTNGVLTINAADLSFGPRIDALIADVFSGVLTITTGAAEIGTTSVTYPLASLSCSGFIFYDEAVQVASVLTVSSSADDTLDLKVAATMPTGWELTDSFVAIAAISTSPIQQLAAKSGTFTVDSALSSTEAELDVELVTADSVLASLEWLLGPKIDISGAAGFTVGPNDVAYPIFTLSSDEIAGAQVSGYNFDVVVNVRSTASAPELPDGSWPLFTSVDLTLDLVSPDLTLPLLIALYDQAQTRYSVILNPYAAAPSIGSLKQLDGFAWGQTVSIPGDSTPQGALSLASLSVLFDATGPYLGALQFSVSLGTDWTIIPNITLIGLTSQVYIPIVWGGTPPTGDDASYTISVTAEFLIATASINVTVTYPAETVLFSLAPDTSIDVNAFLNALAPGVTLPGSGDLTIITLSILADIPTLHYSVNAYASGELAILPDFILTSLGFGIDWQGSSLTDCQFSAEFTIAGAPLSMFVAYQAEHKDWYLSGGCNTDSLIYLSILVSDIASIFGVSLPADLPEIVLTPLDMTYDTSDGSFTFDATVSYFTGDDPVLTSIQGTMNIAYDGTAKRWTGGVSGTIILDEENSFTVAYDFRTDQVISLSWTAIGEKTIGIDDLCKLFGATDMQQMIPPDLDLALTEVIGTYDITKQMVVFACRSKTWGEADVGVWYDTTNKVWSLYFGVDITLSISLTDLPLIGTSLASVGGDVALTEIQAAISNVALTAAQAQTLTAVIPAGYPTPPAAGLLEGGALAMVFDAAGKTTRISIGTTDATGGSPAPVTSSSGGTVPNAPGGTTVATAPDGTCWFSLQQSFGPVTIQKVGVRYSDSILWCLMNASLTSGGLEIDMLGLGIGSPLSTFTPSFSVDGIVVSLEEGGLAISGALVGKLDPLNLYGELSVVLGDYTIGAIAGYANYQDQPSFFMYGVLNGPLGGPPFFFVTGLAAGFGLNRSLVIPEVGAIYQFPLVQWAVGINAPSANPAGDIGAQVESTMNSLAASGVIAPALGESWFAAGISFTSFEMVDSFALAVFVIGDDLEIDLLGLSTVAVPPAPSAPVAEAQLALKATIKPSTGLISITGQLTPNSYALSKSAKLTGGFAYSMWVSGEHAGEFVMTQGGYSPHYVVPDYYPQVPRLGLHWQVDSCLSITGTLYFALTSSAVMAGGSLSAVWTSGGIRAWFDVEADFLMVFLPFQYYLSGSITLGASVRINLYFTRVTISAHIGVGFELWGPDFSGKIKVDLSVVSFTIAFGRGTKNGPTTISWSQFVEQLLPSQASSSSAVTASPGAKRQSLMARKRAGLAAGETASQPAILQFAALQGVQQILSDVEGELNWLVDAQTFQIQLLSSIPLKTYDSQSPQIVISTGDTQNTAFGCGPVGVANGDFFSNVSISLTSTEDSVFKAVKVFTAVPTALWQKRAYANGVPQNVNPVQDTTITNVLTAFTLIPTVEPPDQTPLPIPLANLDYTIDPDLQSFSWSAPIVQTADSFVSTQTVASTIASQPALSNRPKILAAINRAGLDVDRTIDVGTLSSAASNALLDQPVLCYLGEAKA